ncbi:methylated-DNA-[protein]-cysteine S-methyltransferase [Microlunatus sagamiharensis]|uniref:methylated-DNA--[protein]-cysteine S-methyltransferase n=1 Tax=Microlunatus sagamiharensis TaxID=546874 RepID=A0A1H2LKG0_9ACTN|nr:methylated-DNA--[protein]-cysteine S-methyltransferase [Microlunatus sagamiharensis]SDU81497.1 methylated-DNA-[protein]-cysteine S-methyltransferase [Microlunatus sagamiharensis]
MSERAAEAFDPTGSHLERLLGRLVDEADRRDGVDVGYRTVDGPVGPLLLAATPAGLVRVAFASEGEDAVLQELADRVSPRVLPLPARLDETARELDEYFAGRRHRFDVALDWQLSGGYRREVLSHLAVDVEYGRTTSYAGLAAMTGSPRAVRAVGTACATNPIPVVVPCHRVVRSDGSMGRYRGGEEAKHVLLELEGAR